MALAPNACDDHLVLLGNVRQAKMRDDALKRTHEEVDRLRRAKVNLQGARRAADADIVHLEKDKAALERMVAELSSKIRDASNEVAHLHAGNRRARVALWSIRLQLQEQRADAGSHGGSTHQALPPQESTFEVVNPSSPTAASQRGSRQSTAQHVSPIACDQLPEALPLSRHSSAGGGDTSLATNHVEPDDGAGRSVATSAGLMAGKHPSSRTQPGPVVAVPDAHIGSVAAAAAGSSATDLHASRSPTHRPSNPRRRSSTNRIEWTRGQLLGEGAFSVVYLGLNKATGGLLAVKQLKKEGLGHLDDYGADGGNDAMAELEEEIAVRCVIPPAVRAP